MLVIVVPSSCVQMFSSAAALLLFVAAAANYASALVILPKNDTTLLKRICKNQLNGTSLCYPFDVTSYVTCAGGIGKRHRCHRGFKYDYGKRTCLNSTHAKPCPRFNCPNSDPAVDNITYPLGVPPLSRPYGTFGVPGNVTLQFNYTGHYAVYCPVYGHCPSGMLIDVTILTGGLHHVPITYNYPTKKAEWEEVLGNTDLYPKKLPGITLAKGDKLFIDWDEPVHLVAVYDRSNASRLVPTVPYPPQPIYKCPNWNMSAAGGYKPLPGEIQLNNFPPPPVPHYLWGPANKTESFFFVCPLGNHCRLGMVFKTTVVAAPANYQPKVYQIGWFVTYENFPDMTIYVGDKMNFTWGGSQAVHLLSTLPKLEAYNYTRSS